MNLRCRGSVVKDRGAAEPEPAPQPAPKILQEPAVAVCFSGVSTDAILFKKHTLQRASPWIAKRLSEVDQKLKDSPASKNHYIFSLSTIPGVDGAYELVCTVS